MLSIQYQREKLRELNFIFTSFGPCTFTLFKS
jgi:hypothetical protein